MSNPHPVIPQWGTRMNRRGFLRTAGVIAAAGATSAWRLPRAAGQLPFMPSSAIAAARRPDIVLILTDDQRWSTLDRLGSGWPMPIVKPRLVDRGVRFTNAFVQNPVCCASRATLLTGRPSHVTGIWNNNPPVG